ncbi:uncharacterized protein N7511_001768 [Penicillium nucicola]|uniref:uncharacterized protein n=1 Tax=Penicillium nucicola TaxID=1850975 RepID=UPI0025451B59|nr:uncharacterized protein N7511_001768 [Penicillium nucicola]KAJ5769717.1 hypothetical protein N7511_001768 [Penicillium nucicola]
MSSHNELSDCEAQESISEYSDDLISEDDISETSEDRAFVVSDGEQSAYSNRSSASFNDSQYSSNDSSNFNGQKVPLCIVTKQIPVTKVPFIYSKTEELVWKWEQSKLCGQSINVTLSSNIIPPAHSANKADSRGEYVSIENGVIHVFPQAQLSNLEPHDYQIGILQTAHSANLKIILLGSKKEKQTSRLRKGFSRFQRPLMQRSDFSSNRWSTEFWISDSVVVDSRSTEQAISVLRTVLQDSRVEAAYVCVGLPVTIFGPLFNTLVSKWNASAASFEYSNGFIWMYSTLDPANFTIDALDPASLTNDSLSSLLERMNGKSWLARAKLMFRLEISSREKATILAELLEISHIHATSSHKPITHC